MYQVRLDNLSFESVPATVLEIFNTLDTKDRQKWLPSEIFRPNDYRPHQITEGLTLICYKIRQPILFSGYKSF